MKKKICCLFTLILLICGISQVYATGLGFYGTYGHGNLNVPIRGWYGITGGMASYNSYGGGFVFDTNLSQRKLFNYRFNIGLELIRSNSDSEAEMWSFSWNNTFGLALYSSKLFRLYMGPQLGINIIYGENSYIDYMPSIDFSFNTSLMVVTETCTHVLLGARLGVVLGLNFNIGPQLTLSIEGGGRYSAYVEAYSAIKYGGNIKFEYPPYGFEGFTSLSVMFRVGVETNKNRNEVEVDVK